MEVRAFRLTGTGAAIQVECGFKPELVLVLNETQLSLAFHVSGMADGRALAVDDSGAGATDVELKTSGGVTLQGQGFTLGTDADLNTASDVIWAVAIGRE